MNPEDPGVVTYRGKRVFDVLLAAAAMIVLMPVLLVVGLVVRCTMGSPVFFRQERPGLSGKPFTIFKFRTMTNATDESGDLLSDGERLGSVGRFLRRTSLDELPELWNVLRGEMSLVGPRPLLFRYMPYFRPREMRRLLALPGITGLAQVSGRNFMAWDDRLELDARYIDTMSLLLDLKILFRTVVAVFRREGVSADVDAVETWLDEERAGDPTLGPKCGSRLDGMGGDSKS